MASALKCYRVMILNRIICFTLIIIFITAEFQTLNDRIVWVILYFLFFVFAFLNIMGHKFIDVYKVCHARKFPFQRFIPYLFTYGILFFMNSQQASAESMRFIVTLHYISYMWMIVLTHVDFLYILK